MFAPTRGQIPQKIQPRVWPGPLKDVASVRLRGRPEKKKVSRPYPRLSSASDVVVMITSLREG